MSGRKNPAPCIANAPEVEQRLREPWQRCIQRSAERSFAQPAMHKPYTSSHPAWARTVLEARNASRTRAARKSAVLTIGGSLIAHINKFGLFWHPLAAALVKPSGSKHWN